MKLVSVIDPYLVLLRIVINVTYLPRYLGIGGPPGQLWSACQQIQEKGGPGNVERGAGVV